MKIKDFYTKQDIEFKDDITLYVCGPTVYNEPHIGNMRPIIIFDVLNRVSSLTNNVKFVHNITDVDDKIIKRAKELSITEEEVSKKYENIYMDLLEELNIIKPTFMPKVTDNIDGMIKFINELIEKGFAYESNGSVYFEVNNFENYARLDKNILEGLTDISKNQDKRNIKDFALWKKTDNGINWDSPWGKGRPGWHSECAFFIKEYFGDQGIDIHGGGIDLKFPHHINEMAQYEAHTGNNMSKAWSYVGHVQMDSEKMSKSEGKFISANDFIDEYGSNVLRMIMYTTSISKPIDLTEDVISNAKNIIKKIRNTLTKTLVNFSTEDIRDLAKVQPNNDFIKILNKDLDTVSAITYLIEQTKILNSDIETERKVNIVEELIANLFLLGIKFEINYNIIKNDIKKAKEDSDFESLDKLRERMVV